MIREYFLWYLEGLIKTGCKTLKSRFTIRDGGVTVDGAVKEGSGGVGGEGVGEGFEVTF